MKGLLKGPKLGKRAAVRLRKAGHRTVNGFKTSRRPHLAPVVWACSLRQVLTFTRLLRLWRFWLVSSGLLFGMSLAADLLVLTYHDVGSSHPFTVSVSGAGTRAAA